MRYALFTILSCRLYAHDQRCSAGMSSQSNVVIRPVCLRSTKPVILDVIEDPYDVGM